MTLIAIAAAAIGIAYGSASVSGVVRIGRVIVGVDQAGAADRHRAVVVGGGANAAHSRADETLPPERRLHYEQLRARRPARG